MNFPYYIYPSCPYSGYYDIEKYNQELVRLNSELLQLNLIKRPILFHITIGAPMEEYFDIENKEEYRFQWQQLLPNHIRTHLENGGEVVHFIVSPTQKFDSNRLMFFVYETPEYDWSIKKNKYTSRKYKYTVNIFYTMMPTVDKRNKKICSILSTNPHTTVYSTLLLQTDTDIQFVEIFYTNLQSIVSNINTYGGIVTCFSFAVFHQITPQSKIKNYKMFEKIKQCGINVLAEWIFSYGCYVLELHGISKQITYIRGVENISQICINTKPDNTLNLAFFPL